MPNSVLICQAFCGLTYFYDGGNGRGGEFKIFFIKVSFCMLVVLFINCKLWCYCTCWMKKKIWEICPT